MRILLSIGCNNYSLMNSLSGAEKDAQSVFSALVGENEHQYDQKYSKLLLSPSGEEFRNAFSDVLYCVPEIVVFTFYFAGHAGVSDETLYLALKDSNPTRIEATAVGFPEVLRIAAAARPKQINFILDACNANGLGFDIAPVLKRAIVGKSDSTGISFVAAASAEQSANETTAGGNFTVEFTKAVRGDTFIQSARPFLNLAEIAQQVQIDWLHPDQTISYWTLNLQGPNLFAKNLHYSGPSHVTDRIALQLSQKALSTKFLSDDFKAAIVKIPHGIRERDLSKTLGSVFSKIEPSSVPSAIQGLTEGLRLELSDSHDHFLESRLYTILLGQILASEASTDREETIAQIIDWFCIATRRAIATLSDAMDADRNALLLNLMSDLYDLPVRISDVLGQCALLLFRSALTNDIELVKSVVKKILTRYGNSVLAVTDEQAVGYFLFLEICRRLSWIEYSEEIIGRLYHDLENAYGRCGAYSLDAKERLELLSTRYSLPITFNVDLYNFPSDLTSVVLSYAAIEKLDEAIDYSLIQIDHTAINYFIPENVKKIGIVKSMEGTNITLTLGRDFWRCIDLRRILLSDIFPKFDSAFHSLTSDEVFCSLASALALKDRIPWHAAARD